MALWLTTNQQMMVRPAQEFSPAVVTLGDTFATELSKRTCNLGARHNYWYLVKSHML